LLKLVPAIGTGNPGSSFNVGISRVAHQFH
jgi:hypothetical protein